MLVKQYVHVSHEQRFRIMWLGKEAKEMKTRMGQNSETLLVISYQPNWRVYVVDGPNTLHQSFLATAPTSGKTYVILFSAHCY